MLLLSSHPGARDAGLAFIQLIERDPPRAELAQTLEMELLPMLAEQPSSDLVAPVG